jgi:hypothetical protein
MKGKAGAWFLYFSPEADSCLKNQIIAVTFIVKYSSV